MDGFTLEKTMNRVISRIYVNGSCGNMNLFKREKGTKVECKNGDSFIQDKDAIILQWDGYPDYDSGYHRREFASLSSALTYIQTHY